MKKNSTSHKTLGKCFKQAGLQGKNDDLLWDLDKVQRVLEKLKEAHTMLKVAQKKHKEHHDAGLQSTLEQHKTTIKESDDPKAAKKAAVAVVSNSQAPFI